MAILETNECAASGAGCSYVVTRKGVMCEYCGGDAPEGHVDDGRRVAHIVGDGYRGRSSSLLATLLVGALAASASMAEVPRRTTRPTPIPETYEERLRREAREQQPKIDRAEAKRQRKAEKLRRRGRL